MRREVPVPQGEGGLLRRVVPVLLGEKEACCAEWCLLLLGEREACCAESSLLLLRFVGNEAGMECRRSKKDGFNHF